MLGLLVKDGALNVVNRQNLKFLWIYKWIIRDGSLFGPLMKALYRLQSPWRVYDVITHFDISSSLRLTSFPTPSTALAYHVIRTD